MKIISIPYGKSHIEVSIPNERLMGILESRAHNFKPEAGEGELVQRALENPIAAAKLRELAKGR